MTAFFSRVVEVAQAKWRILLIVALVLLIGGYVSFGRSSVVGPTLTIVRGEFVKQVSVSGTVIAAEDAQLGFAASGRIRGIYARVGDFVEAGSILAETENGDLVAALVQAKANLSSLQIGARPEQVAVAEAAVASAETTLSNAVQSAYIVADDAVHNKIDTFFSNPRTDPKLSFNVSNASLKIVVERDRSQIEPVLTTWATHVASFSSLASAGALSPESLAAESQGYLAQITTLLSDTNAALNQASPDQTSSAATIATYVTSAAAARSSLNTAATTLTNALAALDSAKKNLTLTKAGPTPEALAAQTALVQSAQSALAKTRVVAPFSGIVTRMDAKEGEVISPTTSEISIQSAGIFEIETFVPEVAIAQIASGNLATVTLDAYGSGVTFPAKVVAVDPAETVKEGVPTYKTTLSFLSKDARIRSGMTADVQIETGKLTDAIVIPAGAVKIRTGVSSVLVVKGDTTEERQVKVGPSPALGQAEILSGLSAGDVILLAPK